MVFKPGDKPRLGHKNPNAGRKPSLKTQVKRFKERHPDAYDDLMEVLYAKGMQGESEDAKYVCNRLQGMPSAKVGLDEDTMKLIDAQRMARIAELAHNEVASIEAQYRVIDDNNTFQLPATSPTINDNAPES
jgi:hypothetical protein